MNEDVIELAIPEEQVPFDGDLIYDDVVDENGVRSTTDRNGTGFLVTTTKMSQYPRTWKIWLALFIGL